MLIDAESLFVREPATTVVTTRRGRRSFLAKLRNEVASLRAIGLDHAVVGRTLGISEIDARALSPSTNDKILRRRLTRRAVNALLHGRHANVGGRTSARRAKHLIKIASAYTFEELLNEPGIGQATVIEIQLWLEEAGTSLRPPP